LRRIGVLTGLAAEARLFRKHTRNLPHSPVVSLSCAESGRARREAGRLAAGGAEVLMSFGLAGGLQPGLRPGDLLLADRVILADGRAVAADAGWRERLASLAEGGGVSLRTGPIAGSDVLLIGSDQKHALGRRTGAMGVDMESHALAEAARRSGLPLLALRAIADPLEQGLPRAVLDAVNERGGPRLGVMAGRAVLSPGEFPALIRLWRWAPAVRASNRACGPFGRSRSGWLRGSA